MRFKNEYNSDHVVHPGEILYDYCDSLDLSVESLSARSGLNSNYLKKLLNKNGVITKDDSSSLSTVFKLKPLFWFHLNSQYLMQKLKVNKIGVLKSWISDFPVQELRKRGYLPNDQTWYENSDKLFNLFEIGHEGELQKWEKVTARFRRTTKNFSDRCTAVWIKLVSHRASELKVSKYSKDKFKEGLKKIRDLTKYKIDFSKIERLCGDYGVAFVVEPEFKGTALSGTAFKYNDMNPLIGLTLRYKTDEQFWFTFFHEAVHVLSDSNKSYLDLTAENQGAEEKLANKVAREFLIPSSELLHYYENTDITSSSIKSFAKRLNICPGIVVGRLQHECLIRYNQFNGLKRKLVLRDSYKIVDD